MEREVEVFKRVFLSAAIMFVATYLSACSLFYPSEIPTKTPAPTKTSTATPTPTPTKTANPNLKKVSLHIIDSSGFKANGYVEVIAEAKGILEDDGQCILTVTQGLVSESFTGKTDQNVTSTQCFPLQVPISKFKTGKASFEVQYVSSKYSGSISGSVAIE